MRVDFVLPLQIFFFICLFEICISQTQLKPCKDENRHKLSVSRYCN